MGSMPQPRRFRAQSVCIIGAGPSGLSAAKYLLAEKAFARIVIFEQRSTVGGIWNYTPCKNSTPDDVPIPQTNPYPSYGEKPDGTLGRIDLLTPLYDRLETNIPRGLMGFSDLDWPSDSQLFPGHDEVLRYIEEYSQSVKHLIVFDTEVLDIKSVATGGWNVQTGRTGSTDDRPMIEEHFDAVIVASGHYDVPFIPAIAGIEQWNQRHPGRISHSKFYRRPEDFAEKKVVVVGNAASGTDIAMQVAQYCRKPLLHSLRSASLFISGSGAEIEKPAIAEFLPDEPAIRFVDDNVERDVDAVLYCTGYMYSFPFLRSLDVPLIASGERVKNLWQHLFYRPDPTLSFLNLNQKVIPFPLGEAQSAVVARVLSGRLTLPSEKEMADWEVERCRETDRERDFHVFKFPQDADQINMFHDMCQDADRDSLFIGKQPPYWEEKEYWVRERFASIRKVFQELEDERHSRRTLESVGYDFDQWKREQRQNEGG